MSPLHGRGEGGEKGRTLCLCSPKFRVEGRPRLPVQPSALPSPTPVLQIGSYYGSEITSVDIDGDGVTDVLLVGAPMYFSEGREQGRVYVYTLRQVLLRGGGAEPSEAPGPALPSLGAPREASAHPLSQAGESRNSGEHGLETRCCRPEGTMTLRVLATSP